MKNSKGIKESIVKLLEQKPELLTAPRRDVVTEIKKLKPENVEWQESSIMQALYLIRTNRNVVTVKKSNGVTPCVRQVIQEFPQLDNLAVREEVLKRKPEGADWDVNYISQAICKARKRKVDNIESVQQIDNVSFLQHCFNFAKQEHTKLYLNQLGSDDFIRQLSCILRNSNGSAN